MRIYSDSHNNYGAPKITRILKTQGLAISEKTVGNYMRQMGIRAQWIRSKPKSAAVVTDSEIKNILKQNFNPKSPNTAWCSDITYIWTTQGFVYLTSVMDLYSRKIIGWSLSKDLSAKAVVSALIKAKNCRKLDKPLIIHSDRGCQFLSSDYLKATEKLQRSYSKKAYPWDNACIEAFHSLIKREWLNRFRILDFNHAYTLVFEYIETFYNTVRIHSHCDFLSPNDFEKLLFSNCTFS